jgi:7-cyano-7-deazaguanine synthase in queuosine biosynthesis
MAPAIFALFGIGGVLVPNQIIITVISPDDLIGSVTALTLAVRAQAQVIGLAIFYNQLQDQIMKNSYKYLLTAAIQVEWLDVAAITQMMSTLTAIPFKEFAQTIPQLADPENYRIMHEATVKVFVASFRHVWFITMAFGIPACVAAAFLGDLSHYLDEHVAAPLT